MKTTERCPKCSAPLVFVKDGPHGPLPSGGSQIIVPVESSIFECPNHGLLRIYISGAVETYREPPAPEVERT